MTYTFECAKCGACGCGVTLYDMNGKVVNKTKFTENPTQLYCAQHTVTKPNVAIKIT